MLIKYYFFPLAALFAFATRATAQVVFQVSGTIQEAANAQPIAFSSAAIYQQADSLFVAGGISDETGHFTVHVGSPGVYYLEISVLGFGKHYVHDMAVAETNRKLDLGVIAIKPQAVSLDEVEVVSERSAIEYRIDRKVVDLSKLGVAGNASLPEALQILPSIETDPQGNVSLRGSGNFQVLVDGRLSMLSPAEALQQYTVAQVEKIEIITNPSAKFQANSTSGIINILLRKEEGQGFSGFLSLGSSAGINHFQPYNFSTTLTYRRKKYSITSVINATDRRLEFNFLTKQRRDNGADLDIFTTNNVPWLRGGASLDFDYFLSDRHTITLAARIIQNDNGFDIKGENHFPEPNMDPFFSRVRGFTNRRTQAITLHDGLKFRKEGHELLILATYFNQSVDQGQSFLEYPTLVEGHATFDQNFDSQSGHHQAEFKTDYTQPIGEHAKLETGIDFVALVRNSRRGTEAFLPEAVPFSVDLFEIASETYAGYATFSHKFWGTDMQAGIRVEQYNRRIEQKGTATFYDYSKLNLFPGVHLAKKIDKKQEVKLTYTGRIYRPSMFELQPYLDWSNNVSSYGGNPALIPATIGSSEASYTYWFEVVTATVEVYFRNTSNQITTGERLNETTRIIEASPVNIDNSRFYGLESSIDIAVADWLKVIVSGAFFQNRISGELFETPIDQQYNGWRARVATNISLPKDIKLNVNGFFDSKALDAQGELASNYWVNISIYSPVLNKRGTLSIDMQDVFGTGRYNRTREGTGFTSALSMRTPRRIVGLNLSYRFNGFRNKEYRFRFED